MPFELRDYQRESVDALFEYWAAERGHGLVVLPTGAGKSLVLAALCQEVLRDYPSLRICVVTHVRELIEQNYKELVALWPLAPAGIYSAGLGRRDTHCQILFCGIQSVWNKTRQIGTFDILLVDEAHLIPRSSQTTYQKFISRLKNEMPDMRIVGLTATAFRLDSGRLDCGPDRVFEDVVYEANVRDLIERGYLSPLVSKATIQQMDVSSVPKRGGEYIPGALEIAVDQDWITRGAVKEIVEFGISRRAWLAFCTGVNHARHVRDAIRDTGVSCETVTGQTPKADRDRIISSFRRGEIRCLTSVGVLGTGFNVPHVDMIALLRPTQSAGLFLQQVGRGLRKADGKTDCLVLDFAGLVKKHGPIDTITSNSAAKAKDPSAEEKVMAKECPDCRTLVALNVMACPTCGHIWPPKEEVPKHEAVADGTLSILSSNKPEWIDVDDVSYHFHHKHGGLDSLRVEYRCGMVVHREWICFLHAGFARQKAEAWWHKHAGTMIPHTIEEALDRQDELRAPSAIRVSADGKFFKIDGRRFRAHEAAE
jgi:DNA repair protein RadD